MRKRAGRRVVRSNDPKEQARQEFIAGRVHKWPAGEYGYTVNCHAERGKLLIRVTQPTRRQWVLPGEGDTPERRQKLTEIAMRRVIDWRSGKVALGPSVGTQSMKSTGVMPSREEKAPLPRVGEAWDYYIESKWPGLPKGYQDWGRLDVRRYYESLEEADRARVPSPDSLLAILQSRRRVTAYASYEPDRPIREIEVGEWMSYTNWRRVDPAGRQASGQPYSYGSIATDYGRFRTVLAYNRKSRPRWWGATPDPLDGADVVRVDPKVPEVGEDRAKDLLRALRKSRSWRTFGAVMLAHGSGRRIGAIGADRLGFSADGLRGSDFRYIDGRLYVTWRAEAAKGEGFGRGDEILPATRTVAVAYRWLRRCHPNPLGPEHPLLWSPQDPSQPVSYAALNRNFKATWREAFGEDAPKGLAFHGFCRTMISTIVDELGLSQAAEYTGRTTRTIEKHYKRVRRETQNRTAELLDRVRAEGERRPPNHNVKSQRIDELAKEQRKPRAFQPGVSSRGRNRWGPILPPASRSPSRSRPQILANLPSAGCRHSRRLGGNLAPQGCNPPP